MTIFCPNKKFKYSFFVISQVGSSVIAALFRISLTVLNPKSTILCIYFLLCKDNNVVMRNLAKTVRVGDNNAANQEYTAGSTSLNKCLMIIFS